MSELDDVKQVAGMARGIGIAHILLGILAISVPMVAGLAVAISVGVLVLISGLLVAWVGLQEKTFGRVAIGVLYVIGGLALLFRPMLGLELLALLIGIWFFAIGVWRLMGAFMVGGRNMAFLLLGAIASLVLGGLILAQWPLSGAWAIGVLVGVELVFGGIVMLNVGNAVKDAANAADAQAG
jgi:uncharacterized membrane protein HdeD (DUF308 family)